MVMELKEAVSKVWENRKYTPKDIKEAVSHLNEEVAETMKALMKGEDEKAKREIEDALSCLLIAIKMFDIDIDEAINRQLYLMKVKSEKVMIFKKDKVEILVNGKLKGGWTIWGEEDLREAERLAKDFNCSVKYED
jgi:NTP pyrophosphatase (non-canonical NTP hydrolase)